MKNSLTIYGPNNTKNVFRNVENFQTLENGVSIFEVGSETVSMHGATFDYESRSLPVGTRVKFKGDFAYYDYTQTAAGEYEEPKSDGGHW